MALDTAKTGSRQTPLDALPVGYIVDAAKVIEVIERQGVYVDIGVNGVKGFVHVISTHLTVLTIQISRLSDDAVHEISATSGPFKVSSLHHARITGYNPVDNLFQLSFEQRVLAQPFLRIEDVEVGSTLTGTVERILDKGIVIRLAEGITGWISVEQSADALPTATEKAFGKQVMVWEKRFKEESVVKVKVRLCHHCSR
jgi:rRNA biogenesis protein RRP5